MNVIEIEEAVADIAEKPFDEDDFFYDFMAAYGANPTTITRLKDGSTNKTDIPNGILWRNWVHYIPNPAEGLSMALERLETSAATKRGKCRYILTTDGNQVAARDLKSDDHLICDFSELDDKFGFFLPIAGYDRYRAADENVVDIKATGKLSKLYDALVRDNPDWGTSEKRHDMNQFMTRIIFCLFAEDTGIFEDNLFSETLVNYGGEKGGSAQQVLQTAFEIMNLDGEPRERKPEWAKQFPFVNGGLFAGSRDAPKFGPVAYLNLIEAGKLDWKEINPDIFGSMIQSIVDDEMRGDLGMHYTSVPNIMKLLEPLFLDGLQADLQKAWKSKDRLNVLLNRISKIRVFDPACGSGNFLVIAYRELRRLEIEILKRLGELSGGFTPSMWSHIDLKNFYGIEYADFAAETAKLSLWIAEYQMNRQYKDAFNQAPPALPLRDGGNIKTGNALRIDWMEVCPLPTITVNKKKVLDLATVSEVMDTEKVIDEEVETYLVGNPPYLGSTWQSPEQKEDMRLVFDHHINGWKSLDYVAAWFLKGAEYCQDQKASYAFVATNSIVQGQQVPLLWPLIFEHGLEIGFAHTSFKWANNALNKAGVTVVIVGVRSNSHEPKYIISDGFKKTANNLNAYLVDGANVIVNSIYKPLSDLPSMLWGNKPTDGGNLILSADEASELIDNNPKAKKFVRPYFGSQEFIRGISRFCLWIDDAEVEEALAIPEILVRVEAVKEMRSASKAAETRPAASYPHRFRQIQATAKKTSIVIPSVSSESRPYLPVGYLKDRAIVSNLAFAIYDAPIWTISLIASRLHLLWVATVCGKLETRYRYSNTMGWNTFPAPSLSDEGKTALEKTAQGILLAREAHFPDTIATLYDPKKMPDDLLAAHRKNDEVLEAMYSDKPFKSDAERLEHLFKRYVQMTQNND